jgi:hypothetical protein
MQTARLSRSPPARRGVFLGVQCAVVEKAKIEARKKGHAVTETLLQDGSIRVQIATA